MTTERNAQGVDGLAEVMGLLGRLPEGDWTIGKVDEPSHHGGDDGWDDLGGVRVDAPGIEQIAYFWNANVRLHPTMNPGPAFGADGADVRAAAAIAAVNYLRSHGEAIRELVEAGRELVKAQAEYDRLDVPGGRKWDRLCFARERHAAALAKFPEPRP